MKIKASIIIAALAANSLFAEPMTSANIAGRTYKEILGVSLNPDGSIGVVIGSGISNFPIEDVSTEFLNSWGISEEQVEAVAANADSFIAERSKKERAFEASQELHKRESLIKNLNIKLQKIRLEMKKIEAQRNSAKEKYGTLGLKRAAQQLVNDKTDVSANTVEYYKKEMERLDILLKKYKTHADSLEKQLSSAEGIPKEQEKE